MNTEFSRGKLVYKPVKYTKKNKNGSRKLSTV